MSALKRNILWLLLSATGLSAHPVPTCPSHLAARAEILEALQELGAESKDVLRFWPSVSLQELPDGLLRLAKRHAWPEEELQRLFSLMHQLANAHGLKADDLEVATYLVAERAFGLVAPSGHTEDCCANPYEDEGPVLARSRGAQSQSGQDLKQISIYLDAKERQLGRSLRFEDFSTGEFLMLPSSALSRVWFSRIARSRWSVSRQVLLKKLLKHKPRLLDLAAFYLKPGGLISRQWDHGKNLRLLAEKLQVDDLNRAFDIAKAVLGQDEIRRQGWLRTSTRSGNLGSVVSVAHFDAMLAALQQTKADGSLVLQGEVGCARFAADYFERNRKNAVTFVRKVLTPSQWAALNWEESSDLDRSDLHYVRTLVQKDPEKFAGIYGIEAACLITGLAPKTVGVHLPELRNSLKGKPSNLSLQHYLYGRKWIYGGEAKPLPAYIGEQGLPQLAADYFMGEALVAFQFYAAILNAQEFRELKWKRPVLGQWDLSALKSFQGKVLPPRMTGHKASVRLAPSQKFLARLYLVEWLDRGERIPEAAPLSDFLNADTFFEAVNEEAEESSIALDWLEWPYAERPERLRLHQQYAAVDRTLEWMIAHPGKTPEQMVPDRGLGRSLEPSRFFGEGAYARELRMERIFDHREQAYEAIRTRAASLRIRLAGEDAPFVE